MTSTTSSINHTPCSPDLSTLCPGTYKTLLDSLQLNPSLVVISYVRTSATLGPDLTNYPIPRAGSNYSYPVSFIVPRDGRISYVNWMMDNVGEFTAGTITFKLYVNGVVVYSTGILTSSDMTVTIPSTGVPQLYYPSTLSPPANISQGDNVGITITTSHDFAGGPEGPISDVFFDFLPTV